MAVSSELSVHWFQIDCIVLQEYVLAKLFWSWFILQGIQSTSSVHEIGVLQTTCSSQFLILVYIAIFLAVADLVVNSCISYKVF